MPGGGWGSRGGGGARGWGLPCSDTLSIEQMGSRVTRHSRQTCKCLFLAHQELFCFQMVNQDSSYSAVCRSGDPLFPSPDSGARRLL